MNESASITELLEQAHGQMARRDWAKARLTLERVLASGPQHADAYNDYGRVLNNLGELDAAAQAFASALGLDPDNARTWNNLGHVLRAQGKLERAAEHFSRAVTLQPDFARAHFNRASVLNLLGDNNGAVACLREGLRFAPRDITAHCNLATLYRFMDQYEPARQHFEAALRIDPDCREAQLGLAGLCVHLGQIEAARELYQAVLSRTPADVEARVGLADIMDLQGRREDALQLLDAGDAPDPRVAVARANLLQHLGKPEQALQTLQAAKASNASACEQMPRYFYCLGAVYDGLQRYSEAMASYRQANAMQRGQFDPAELNAAIDALVEVFDEKWLADAPDSGDSSERPVFVLGMPRSGTTLVEQILASHPAVCGGGELNLVVGFVRELNRGTAPGGSYPRCVHALGQADFKAMAERYLQALRDIDTETARVTDKLPHNFLHLGLISRILPRARVIHCIRDFRDTALSCFFQNFSSASMAFTNTLEDIGHYYRQYLRLMRHWQQVLNLEILDVQYETLVAQQEEESRRMVDFLGLDWDAACLAFHKTGRMVNTASYAQVDKPVYASSVQRYRHYEEFLNPLLDAVGDLP